MANRPSVKEILEAARRSGPAQPAGEPAPAPAEVEPAAEVPAEPEAVAAEAVETTAPEPAAPPPNVPTPSSLGRPLTLAEKLAAARAGGAVKPAAAARPAAPKPARIESAPPAGEPAAAPAAAEAPPPPAAPLPTPSTLGRPLTLAEKLAAARSGGAKPAPAAGARPAAAKAAPAAAKAAPTRTLPPLEKMTDPKDLAEAARQAAAKVKPAAAKPEAPAAAKAAKHGAAKKEAAVVPPRPRKAGAVATAEPSRRDVMRLPWIALGWATFTAGMAALTAACGRFMFPNVLAEPPSTIKVGLPTNFEPGEVNERWKAEWGFWIVRSSAYNGQDIVYAIKSVCTHLGCPPNWLAAEQKFKCPCHGSGFYITGVNFEGPAPRPLERYKVVLSDDGQIMVDKSQFYQQEMGQWDDPDSFIAV